MTTGTIHNDLCGEMSPDGHWRCMWAVHPKGTTHSWTGIESVPVSYESIHELHGIIESLANAYEGFLPHGDKFPFTSANTNIPPDIRTRIAFIEDARRKADRHINAHHFSAYPSRIDRQTSIGRWVVEAFGQEEGTSLAQRGIRLLEEAAEAAQVTCVTKDMAHKIIDYVWSRPVGEMSQELGGVGVATLALAQAAGFDADKCEALEVNRVLSKPLEHFRERNRAKNEAGLLVTSPGKPNIEEIRERFMATYPGQIGVISPLWGEIHWQIIRSGKSSSDSEVLGSDTTEDKAWINAALKLPPLPSEGGGEAQPNISYEVYREGGGLTEAYQVGAGRTLASARRVYNFDMGETHKKLIRVTKVYETIDEYPPAPSQASGATATNASSLAFDLTRPEQAIAAAGAIQSLHEAGFVIAPPMEQTQHEFVLRIEEFDNAFVAHGVMGLVASDRTREGAIEKLRKLVILQTDGPNHSSGLVAYPPVESVSAEGEKKCPWCKVHSLIIDGNREYCASSNCSYLHIDSQLSPIAPTESLLQAAENLYAFAEAFGEGILTDEGKRQLTKAFETLQKYGSTMSAPKWDKPSPVAGQIEHNNDFLYSRNKWHMVCTMLDINPATSSAATVLDMIPKSPSPQEMQNGFDDRWAIIYTVYLKGKIPPEYTAIVREAVNAAWAAKGEK